MIGDGSPRLINRELSWLAFNQRVLEEAQNSNNPLLERLKFLSIFESNLDEFYMVRVSGLIEQCENKVKERSPDGLTPLQQLNVVAKTAYPLRKQAADVWKRTLNPELSKKGIRIKKFDSLTKKQREQLDAFFQREVFPLCTPLILFPAATIPFISNRSLNLIVDLSDSAVKQRLARVKVPDVLPRLVSVGSRGLEFVLLEDVIAANLDVLFPGVPIRGSYLCRVIRDADIEIRELEAADLITSLEESIRMRRFGDPVLLEVENTMPERVQRLLLKLLNLDRSDMFAVEGPLAYEFLWEIAGLDRPDLHFPNHIPYLNEQLSDAKHLFDVISKRDLLVHHPYDSFRSVEQFVGSGASDPAVIGIKQTLYRVGAESPVVESLLDAAEVGKQVAALVELKARFDESNNLVWARALERAGVHVTYGFSDMKTHCKLSLVVRREAAGVKTYAHIGTGNYNPATARLYTDLGLFTQDPEITQDISELFNYLTGYSRQEGYRKLLVAPTNLREGVLELIEETSEAAKRGEPAKIVLKVNSLVDPEAIEALYSASAAGVQIDLIVRGICCLRPGVVGLSETIRVKSIVGRFLEHSRIYWFEAGTQRKALIGSADLMRRNLDRRIEVLVPVERPDLQDLLWYVLETSLADTQQSWDLTENGGYVRHCAMGEPFDAQAEFIKNPLSRKQLTGMDHGKS